GNRICNSLSEGGVTETYANNFEAGDRLAGWSRADSSFGTDSVTNTVYLYAASGCTTNVLERHADGTERRVSYTWTDDYRLASVSVGGEPVAEYAYDVLGNLVAVANDEESFEILVDNGHSLADVAADGRTLRVYMRAPGVDNWLGFVDMTGSSPVPYFYVTDHLGSVLAVTDANGNLVERYEYDAWGKVLSGTDANGNALTRSAIGNRILWQAREYSWTTGLYYFRNRWYDPVIGRWISKDPIGLSGGMNLYVACRNDFVNHTDGDGLYPGERSYIETEEGRCLNGDKIANDIRLFYDGIDDASHSYWWVPKGFTSYVALFSLSGGPWGPCDFKCNYSDCKVYYNNEYFQADEFGNYIAGYQAGYSGVKGLLTGVKIGGWLWSAVPGDEPIGDEGSLPMINRGYNDGARMRARKENGTVQK
nr:RHS domain-containing protein [Kiritimatiellia bacterium]